MYDLLLLPVTWLDPPTTDFGTAMHLITQLFWNFDIVSSFCTGYHSQREVVMNGYMIAKHYFKTWLLFDLTIVGVDWCMFWLSTRSNNKAAGTARLLKLLRFLRCFRALRALTVFRFDDMKTYLEEIFASEAANAQASISRVIVMIILLNHFWACGWYGIGDAYPEGWVRKMQLNKMNFVYRYTTSYHWSMAQLGMGNTEIEAGNTPERIFSIMYLLFSLSLFSCVISAATNALAKMQQSQAEETRQMAVFGRFCRQNEIPKPVYYRALRYLETERRQLLKRVEADQVTMILNLSGPMQSELFFYAHMSHFKSDPILRGLCEHAVDTMQVVATETLSGEYFASEDCVFNGGEVANKAYCVTVGELDYQAASSLEPSSIGLRCWISEPALWTRWRYRGGLQARTECRLVALDVHHFGDVIRGHNPDVWREVATHAADFIANLNGMDRPDVLLVSDITSSHQVVQSSRHRDGGPRPRKTILGLLGKGSGFPGDGGDTPRRFLWWKNGRGDRPSHTEARRTSDSSAQPAD